MGFNAGFRCRRVHEMHGAEQGACQARGEEGCRPARNDERQLPAMRSVDTRPDHSVCAVVDQAQQDFDDAEVTLSIEEGTKMEIQFELDECFELVRDGSTRKRRVSDSCKSCPLSREL